jgi:ribosomal RNA methyltransferase Nop2
MGRRAKNKQGPPRPLQEEGSSPNQTTGKRKASNEAAGVNQPRKKLKDASNKTIVSPRPKPVVPNGKGRPQKNQMGTKSAKKVQFSEDEDEDGWDDVEYEATEVDLKAQARWAPVQLLLVSITNVRITRSLFDDSDDEPSIAQGDLGSDDQPEE